jgi:hypothetical protein
MAAGRADFRDHLALRVQYPLTWLLAVTVLTSADPEGSEPMTIDGSSDRRKRALHTPTGFRDSLSNIALWRSRRSGNGISRARPIALATESGS